jgi:hypothetical protein
MQSIMNQHVITWHITVYTIKPGYIFFKTQCLEEKGKRRSVHFVFLQQQYKEENITQIHELHYPWLGEENESGKMYYEIKNIISSALCTWKYIRKKT